VLENTAGVRWTLLCAGFIVWICGAVVAQQASVAAGSPAFEVVSVKPNNSGDLRATIGVQPGGRFIATNINTLGLIGYAYQLQDYQIVNGPPWLRSERFDVLAKAADDVPMAIPQPGGPPNIFQLMVRELLADRFELIAHNEMREMPIFHLVFARADRRLGPKIKASTCAAVVTRDGGPPGSPATGQQPTCGIRLASGALSAGGWPLSGLAGILSQFVQRPVIDRTGQSGLFDFELVWTPDPPVNPAVDNLGTSAVDANRPVLTTALREQLGLRLDAERDSVEALVLDRVERPSRD